MKPRHGNCATRRGCNKALPSTGGLFPTHFGKSGHSPGCGAVAAWDQTQVLDKLPAEGVQMLESDRFQGCDSLRRRGGNQDIYAFISITCCGKSMAIQTPWQIAPEINQRLCLTFLPSEALNVWRLSVGDVVLNQLKRLSRIFQEAENCTIFLPNHGEIGLVSRQ